MSNPNIDSQPFRHYTLKHRMISWISRTFFDDITYTVRNGLLKGMKRTGGLGWIPEVARGNPTPEHRFLAGLNVSGRVVFDVGAFEGLVTLFFARHARHVVSYEPNSRNYARLRRNIEINHLDNVTLRKLGLGAEPGSSSIVWDERMAGGGTLTHASSHPDGSGAGAARREAIQVTTLDRDLIDAKLPLPDLIKVDVEGYELRVLQGARDLLEGRHPALYLEMHGETMNEKRANVQAIVEYLTAVGYSRILHVESGVAISRENVVTAAEGHLYAVSAPSAPR